MRISDWSSDVCSSDLMKQGARRPICTTAVGRALLSTKSDKEIGLIVRRLNAEREPDVAPLSLTEILDAVNEGRELGYFVTKGTATPGAGGIADRKSVVSGKGV